VVIWYTFPVLVCLDQEKSGNPGPGKGRAHRFPRDCVIVLKGGRKSLLVVSSYMTSERPCIHNEENQGDQMGEFSTIGWLFTLSSFFQK
jgi:hypothetical protein